MARTKTYTQSQIYEFKPKTDMSPGEIQELAELIRIGVSGDILDKASVHLKKHFVEIKVNKIDIESKPAEKQKAAA